MRKKKLRIIVDAAACAEMLGYLDSCLFIDGLYDTIREEISKENEDYEKLEEEIDSIVTTEIDELKQFLSSIA